MLESLLALSTATSGAISLTQIILNTMASLIIGLGAAYVYMYKNRYSKSFVVTLALLPAMVQIVIMIVNGNIGTGIAVMGAFSLVRFRSIPGSAREIGSIFFAMALGLATGTGFIAYAFMFLAVVGGMTLLLTRSAFGERRVIDKDLKITVPENLNYEGLFDDLFEKYAKTADLLQVRTTNMGSLFELSYRIEMKEDALEKEFIDQIRCRNGNLNIVCSRTAALREEL